jgi:hypothetical protein
VSSIKVGGRYGGRKVSRARAGRGRVVAINPGEFASEPRLHIRNEIPSITYDGISFLTIPSLKNPLLRQNAVPIHSYLSAIIGLTRAARLAGK